MSEDFTKLASDIRQPDKFARIFCEAAKTQKSIHSALGDVVIALLKQNSDAKDAIQAIVKEVDRGYGRFLMGRIGFAIWTIAILLLGELLRYFLKT